MITIIVPALNEAATIAETLERVLSQEGGHEVIVVDGGSTDGTPLVASRYARVMRGPKGRARQMNFGAGEARGDILLFLHADTRLPQGAISGVERAMRDPRVVGGRFKVKLSNPGPIYRLIAFMMNLRDRFIRGFTGDQAIFVRADVFRSLGGYWETPLMEDLDFGQRMARAGRVVRIPMSVVTSSRRWEENGIARTVLLMWVLRLLFMLGVHPARLKKFYGETR